MRHAFQSTALALFLAIIQLSCFTATAGADEHEYEIEEFLVYAKGNISFRENTTVEGHIGGGGWVSIRENAVYTSGNIFADGWVSVKARTTIDGFVLSGGNVDLYHDAVIAGGLQVDGRLTAYERSRIQGNVFATGSITLKPNAVVTGTVNEYSSLPDSWDHPEVDKPKFKRGKHNVEVKQNKSKSLDPGKYKVLRMRPGSTLELTAGKYYFHKVQIDQDFTFEIDDSDGKVEVFIDYNMSTRERGEFKVESGSADGFTLWVSKNISFREDCKFTGHIRCFGNLSLRERTTFSGTIYAKGYFIARENSIFKAPEPAQPSVFYVRKNGSDSNDGISASTAFETIQHAVDQSMKAGSVVYVGPGVYQESIEVNDDEKKDKKNHGHHDDDDKKKENRSGTASLPIRLVADVQGEFTNDVPGDVVVDGRSHDKKGFEIEDVEHWVIQGFTIRNQKDYGVYVKEGGVSILNCTIEVPSKYSIYAKSAGDITIADCVFDRDANSGHLVWITPEKNISSTPATITVTRNDMTMKDSLYMSTGFENGWSAIRNRRGNARHAYGIVINSGHHNTVNKVVVTNNQISDSYLPIFVNLYRSQSLESIVANNTVVGCMYGTYTYASSNQNYTIINNIIQDCYLGTLVYTRQGGTNVVGGILENNITMDMIRYRRPFEDSIIHGNPQFVDAPAGDFTLATGSPGIDAGIDLDAPETDIVGRDRPTDGNSDGLAQIDLGATEFININAPTRVKVVEWREISGHR